MRNEEAALEEFIKEVRMKGPMCLPAAYSLGCMEGAYHLEIYEESGNHKMRLDDGRDYVIEMPAIDLKDLYGKMNGEFSVSEARTLLKQYTERYEEAVGRAQEEQKQLTDFLKSVPERRIITFLVPVPEAGKGELPGRRHHNACQIYAMLREKENGTMRITAVTDELASKWKVTESELYDMAVKNMPLLFPYEIQKLEPLYGSVYLISTRYNCFGTAALFYGEGPLKEISGEVSCDLYLFPLSAHEVAVFPADGIFAEKDISDMAETVSPFGKDVWYYSIKLQKLAFSETEKLELELQMRDGIPDASERRRINAVFG